jgi:hypothetical protein
VSARIDEVPIAPLPDWIRTLATKHTPRSHHKHTVSIDPKSFPVGAAFVTDDLLGDEIEPGIFAALCPNRAEHTIGEDWDGSSVVIAPGPQNWRGVFICLHSHCRDLQ